jgi:hypothetical protein
VFDFVELLLFKDGFHELDDVLKNEQDGGNVGVDKVLSVGLFGGKVSSSSVAFVEKALIFIFGLLLLAGG